MLKFPSTAKWYKKAAELEELDVGATMPVGASLPTEEVSDEDDSSSGYKVPYTVIVDIKPHTNADRLELATVYGFQVVIPKGKFQVGSKVIYIPIDSILPPSVESLLFSENSKIKLNKHRVRQIRIRSLASQGMLVDPSELSSIINLNQIDLETDIKSFLGIKKYQPPAPKFQGVSGPKGRKKSANPFFHQYNGLNNIKWFPNMFQEGDPVVIQEKLHGTNARASKLPFTPNTLWKKFLKFVRLAPAFENCYGSNRVEISAATSYRGFYGEDIYGAVFKALNIFDKIKPGETLFGEIIGQGIQKNYDYGLSDHRFVLFDVKVLNADGTQTWLKPADVEAFANERGIEFVPVLYRGPYNKELAYSLTKGPSKYDSKQKVREGIVIKKMDDYSIEGNKQALKWVSEDYLDDNSNSDFH